MLYALLIVFAGLAALACARLLILSREMRRLSDSLKSDTRKLTTTTGNASIEALCENVNASIDVHKRLAADVQNHEARLRESIANVSHDLRTPLTAILGYLELMKSNPGKMDEYAAIIENRVAVLRELVEAFYELSVADDGTNELTLEPIDLNAVLTNCLLGNHALFENRGITPNVSLPNAPVYVQGDALALERVCQNLIQNALKYAIDKIDVSLTSDGGKVALKISNNTAHITDGDLPRLFDRFYTADKSRSGGSTGVGLYVVKVLVEKMGGSVAAELCGGIFTITLTLPDFR
jgi:signal transduction histidine kinase